MKLLAYTINGQKIGVDIPIWDDTILSGNTPFITITDIGVIPENYSDISNIVNWGNFGEMGGLSYSDVQKEIAKLRPADPSELEPEEKEVLEEFSYSINIERFYTEKFIVQTKTRIVDLEPYIELVANVEGGIYQLSALAIISTNTTKNSIRYSLFKDGEAIFPVNPFSMEFNDVTDERVITLNKDLLLTAGEHTISFEFGAENNVTNCLLAKNS